MAHEDVVAGIAAALAAGAVTADAVAVEARKAAQAGSGETACPPAPPAPLPVTSLTQRRLAALPADARPLPSVAAYDQLLRRPPRAPPTQPRRPIMTIAHHRGMTEQAADVAIDTACRVLRLPTIRAQCTTAADAAEREQMTYRGLLVEMLMAECEDRDRRRSRHSPESPPWPQRAAGQCGFATGQRATRSGPRRRTGVQRRLTWF